MNWAYRLFWTTVMVASVSLMLTACSNKKDDLNVAVQGNISTDGQTLYSKSLFNGRQLTVSISDIRRVNSGYNDPYNFTMPGMSTVQFRMNINEQIRTFTFTPTTTGGQYRQDWHAGYDVFYDSRCSDYSCNNIYLTVWVAIQGAPEWKQMGAFKMLNQDTLGAAFEMQGPQNALISADQMMYELNRLYYNKNN